MSSQLPAGAGGDLKKFKVSAPFPLLLAGSLLIANLAEEVGEYLGSRVLLEDVVGLIYKALQLAGIRANHIDHHGDRLRGVLEHHARDLARAVWVLDDCEDARVQELSHLCDGQCLCGHRILVEVAEGEVVLILAVVIPHVGCLFCGCRGSDRDGCGRATSICGGALLEHRLLAEELLLLCDDRTVGSVHVSQPPVGHDDRVVVANLGRPEHLQSVDEELCIGLDHRRDLGLAGRSVEANARAD